MTRTADKNWTELKAKRIRKQKKPLRIIEGYERQYGVSVLFPPDDLYDLPHDGPVMSLLDAYKQSKTGCWFARLENPAVWYHVVDDRLHCWFSCRMMYRDPFTYGGSEVRFDMEAIMADDWITLPDKETVKAWLLARKVND